MTEVYEHNPQDHEDPATGMTWLVGLIGSVLGVVTLLGTTALYYNVKTSEIREQVISRDYLEILELRLEQEVFLNGPPRWVERQEPQGVEEALVIPIKRAMELVVQENARKRAQAGEVP